MPYKRLEINELVKTMSQAGSTTNNWDVLCSYDLQALNRVLLKEYEKFPVNSQLNFLTNKTISSNIHETLDCKLKFDNPTLSFSSIQSGIYNLTIPISNNSHCNKIIFYKSNIDHNTTITIPYGYNILALGPLKTIKGVGRNKVISSSDEIVEFGNSTQANVVLHFGNDLREVKISQDPDIQSQQDLQDLLDKIKNHFTANITEVDYNIVQVVSETAKLGDVILTPKSFIITTMAAPNNTGVLNVWIQTHESENPQGNPQPSFYPSGTNILPISNNHDSSIIFSKQLMEKLYFRPSLEKIFDVEFTSIDPYTNNPIDKAIGIKLVPKENKVLEKDFSFNRGDVSWGSYWSSTLKCTKLIIDYEKFPFFLVHNEVGQLTIKWNWSQEFCCKYNYYSAANSNNGGGQGLEEGQSEEGRVKFIVDIYIPCLKEVTNSSINMNVTMNQEDIKIRTNKLDSLPDYSWISYLSGFSNDYSNVEFYDINQQIQNSIISHLKKIKISFGSLNYFAEANIFFNEERFKVAHDEALYFPDDAIVIGDIEARQDTHQVRHKRYYHHDQKLNQNAHAIDHMSTESSEFISSSASSITSPINTVINWFSNSFAQFKFLSSVNIITNYGLIKDGIQNIQSIFATSEHISSDNIKNDNVTLINIGQFDVNSSLTLANFIIRCFTKVKPYNIQEESIDLLGVKVHVLNIITGFEKILNDPSIQSYLPVETLEFDPVVLMSKLEKAVINGNYTEIEKILHKSIINNNSHLDETKFSSYIQDKINEMLAQQNAEYSYNQQLISDYSSNNHTTAEDMSNILGIENDINYINHQSEVHLIG